MKNDRMKDALENIARRGVPENTNLWPDISAQLERKYPMTILRTRPFVAVLIALLILLALSGVVYALGRVFGYIPGIGLVDQSTPIRVLAEPVIVEQQGISVTVSKVVADSTRTFISYRVDGIPGGYCKIPEMYLPDGTNLEQTCCSGPNQEYAYSPIPNGTNNVTFMLLCGFPEGGGSESFSFKLPLNLVPAPAGYATPAVEIAVTADGDENKTGLHLEKVFELADSYILTGKFTDGGDLPGPLYMSTASDSEYLPHIEDANGKSVSFKVREDARPDPDWDIAYYWAYEIPKPVATPLKITVDRINIRKDSKAQFQFDTGDHPQVMQTWNLNLPVKLGASDFVVDSVTFLGNGYTFNLSSNNLPEGVAPNIDIVDSSLSPYQFDNISSTVGKPIITITLTSKSPPPTGNLSVNWGLDEYIPQDGPWSLIWTPPNTTLNLK